MNVQEMLEEIPKRYPSAVINTMFSSPPYRYFQIFMENGWMIGCGYDLIHYSDTRFNNLTTPIESLTVEIIIIDPKGDKYIPESTCDGILGWQNSEQVFRILDYISKKEESK